MIHALVVDDQEAVRAGFAALLETQSDITVVATAADGEEAVQLSRAASARRRADGHPNARPRWHRRHPPHLRHHHRQIAPRVLVLTTFDLDEYVYDALQAGASGFFLKDVRPERCSTLSAWSPPATPSSRRR